MASIGHVIVGLCVARAHDQHTQSTTDPPRPLRQRLGVAAAFATLSLLPDFDVVGFRLGVAYSDPWGHRGASHALFSALVLGLVVSWPLARAARASVLPTFLASFVAVGSHGLLDMLTDGGLGAALLWPVSNERLFFPWQPLPVAPIGRNFLSLRGLYCVGVEVALLSPLLLYALWPRRRATGSTTAARSRDPNAA